MRASKGARPAQEPVDGLAGDGMDAQGLLELAVLDGGQYPRHALGEHRLARARGTDHHEAQLAGRRDRDAPLRDLLSADV